MKLFSTETIVRAKRQVNPMRIVASVTKRGGSKLSLHENRKIMVRDLSIQYSLEWVEL